MPSPSAKESSTVPRLGDDQPRTGMIPFLKSSSDKAAAGRMMLLAASCTKDSDFAYYFQVYILCMSQGNTAAEILSSNPGLAETL